MTVKELIEKLKDSDGKLEVLVNVKSNFYFISTYTLGSVAAYLDIEEKDYDKR